MQWQIKITDAEFVQRVERFNGRRRSRFSIVMITFSSIFVALGWYFLQLIESGPVMLIPDDWQTPFQLGVVTGFFGGQIFFMSLFYLCSGLYWFFARRKDSCSFPGTNDLSSWASCRQGMQSDDNRTELSLNDLFFKSPYRSFCVTQRLFSRLAPIAPTEQARLSHVETEDRQSETVVHRCGISIHPVGDSRTRCIVVRAFLQTRDRLRDSVPGGRLLCAGFFVRVRVLAL
jgi:hypothetical protein